MDCIEFDDIRTYCLSKKLATEETPFGPDALVFKVCGKMFALLTFDDEAIRINLKNDPAINLELRERYHFIIPGYHMNKKHWNTVELTNFYDKNFLFSLIDQSYESIIKGLSKKQQEMVLNSTL